ncbi:hypothetical protein GQ44DRAFT_471312 [Phaeosphaeriaceae sp. PMI808]|nr:hypothetical protein GQ44DRAFT_471312 [Phaeosphaeriaceae sp. PMI808]
MSNYSANCINYMGSQPISDPTISACQATANTSFCWPPNGTRICVPSRSITFFWPKSYYSPDSKIELEYDQTSTSTSYWRNNTGNQTQFFTEWIFERKARPILGNPNEKSMKMFMEERRVGSDSLKVHDGPTLILVKTADFTTTSARPAYTIRPGSGSEGPSHDGPHVRSGVIIVCCGRKGRVSGRKIDKDEQARMIKEGTELMEQGGVRQETRFGTTAIAPPKYTP